MYEGQRELRIPLPAEIQEGFMEEVALELCPAGGAGHARWGQVVLQMERIAWPRHRGRTQSVVTGSDPVRERVQISATCQSWARVCWLLPCW